LNKQTLITGRVPRRNSNEIPILEPQEVTTILERSECSRDACLVAILYLSGRRIQEILTLRKRDFILSNPERVTFKTFNEKVFRLERKGRFTYPIEGKFSRKGVSYTTRWYEMIQPQYSPNGLSGKLLHPYVIAHLDQLKDEDYLFAPKSHSDRPYINQSRAYDILRKMDDRLWLHAFRHMTFTRLARLYKDNPLGLHSLTFHKRFDSTIGYIQDVEKGDKLAKF
jgi:integrase